jgi:hypothetical protein
MNPPITIACSRPVKSFSKRRKCKKYHYDISWENHIITTNPIPRLKPPITIATEFTSRHVTLHYTYWLTLWHIGNFRDVPLIEVSVEGGSTPKHWHKERRPIIFSQRARKEGGRTLSKILWQPKEGKYSSNYIHQITYITLSKILLWFKVLLESQ